MTSKLIVTLRRLSQDPPFVGDNGVRPGIRACGEAADEIERLQKERDDLTPPWRQGVLSCWQIVGMNHYRMNGRQNLYVAMTRRNTCIQAEGIDGPELWQELADKARKATERAEFVDAPVGIAEKHGKLLP